MGQQEILEVLKKLKRANARILAKHTNINTENIYQSCKRLHKAGLVFQTTEFDDVTGKKSLTWILNE